MAKPYDAALKNLTTRYARDWASYVGLPASAVLTIIDCDLSTITAAGDRVILVEKPHRCLLSIELQASYDRRMVGRHLKYSAVLIDRFSLPVHSVLVLLRREANSRQFNGTHSWRSPYGSSGIAFEYDVIRIWETPLQEILAGGPGILPLAPLAAGAEKVLPEIVQELDLRFQASLEPGEAAEMWTATYTLMGLRYPEDIARTILRGVRQMRESVTFQAILAEGREEGIKQGLQLGLQQGEAELRRVLLLQGTGLFGSPSLQASARLEAESGIERLEELAQRIIRVKSWDELFG